MLRLLERTLGPVFVMEARRLGRSKRVFWLRGVYLSVLLLGLLSAGGAELTVGGGTHRNSWSLARLAASVFESTAILQCAGIFLLMPILTCDAITSERQQHTLELLRITSLSNLDIILGKLLSRVLIVALMAVAALPVHFLTLLLGGVEPTTILRIELVSLLAALFAGSLSIWMGERQPNAVLAVALSYFWLIGLVAIAGWIPVFGIVFLIAMVLTQPDLPWVAFLALSVVPVLVSIGFVAMATQQLQREPQYHVEVEPCDPNPQTSRRQAACCSFAGLAERYIGNRYRPLERLSRTIEAGSSGVIAGLLYLLVLGVACAILCGLLALVGGGIIGFAPFLLLFLVFGVYLMTTIPIVDRSTQLNAFLLGSPLTGAELLCGAFRAAWPSLKECSGFLLIPIFYRFLLSPLDSVVALLASVALAALILAQSAVITLSSSGRWRSLTASFLPLAVLGFADLLAQPFLLLLSVSDLCVLSLVFLLGARLAVQYRLAPTNLALFFLGIHLTCVLFAFALPASTFLSEADTRTGINALAWTSPLAFPVLNPAHGGFMAVRYAWLAFPLYLFAIALNLSWLMAWSIKNFDLITRDRT